MALSCGLSLRGGVASDGAGAGESGMAVVVG